MRFTETPIPGVLLVDLDRIEDARGFFARTWCVDEFRVRGMEARLAQCSVSVSCRTGTLRGLHFQAPPHAESKLIRCTRGLAHDVVLDLRRGSPTFKRWINIELSPKTSRAIYIPEGCAHGFQTLEDDTELFYQISTPHHAESARGVRWDDPAFAIRWPIENPYLSERDRTFPDFRD